MFKISTFAVILLFQALACFPAEAERQFDSLPKEHKKYAELINLIRDHIDNDMENSERFKVYDTTKDPIIYDIGKCYIAFFDRKDHKIQVDGPAFYIVKGTKETSFRETWVKYLDWTSCE